MALMLVLVSSALASAADVPLRQTIDAEIRVAWQRENISPAPQADDATFLRRIYLDLVGTIPTYDETIAFLDDPATDKRAKLIDRLLDDPRFAQQQADYWDMILFGRNPPGYDTNKRGVFQEWLRQQFVRNTPYDVMVRTILKADGNSADDGPPMYFVQYKNQPEDAIESITQRFLGVQLQCARCHDHPFESWTQLDFYGMAAFLARLEVVTAGKKGAETKYAIGEKSTGDILFTGPASEQEPGKKGTPVKPKFLHGEPLVEPEMPAGFQEVKFESNKQPSPPKFSRKDQLAEWIASPSNPYLAKAVANRLWGQFMGRGLVHPVDNMSEANVPSHPALLTALAAAMVEHKFDLKWYIRELVNSQTYQIGAEGDVAEAMPQWFQRARTRPLSAEELIQSWRVATGYDEVQKLGGVKEQSGRFAGVTEGYMMSFFGRPTTGTGEFQGGLHEHLYLNNGQVSSLIVDKKGSLQEKLVTSEESLSEKVQRLFLTTLNRLPDAEEEKFFVEHLSADGKPAERFREAIWVLITCSEFRFNH